MYRGLKEGEGLESGPYKGLIGKCNGELEGLEGLRGLDGSKVGLTGLQEGDGGQYDESGDPRGRDGDAGDIGVSKDNAQSPCPDFEIKFDDFETQFSDFKGPFCETEVSISLAEGECENVVNELNAEVSDSENGGVDAADR